MIDSNSWPSSTKGLRALLILSLVLQGTSWFHVPSALHLLSTQLRLQQQQTQCKQSNAHEMVTTFHSDRHNQYVRKVDLRGRNRIILNMARAGRGGDMEKSLGLQKKESTKSSKTLPPFPKQATTYIPFDISISDPDNETKILSLLVRRDATDVLSQLRSKSRTETSLRKAAEVDEKTLNLWKEMGVAFLCDEQGETEIMLREQNALQLQPKEGPAKAPRLPLYPADMFVEVGTPDNPLYIKASRVAAAGGVEAFNQALADGEVEIDVLKRYGAAFNNLTVLMDDQKRVRRNDEISVKLNNDFSITSPEWKRWINKTASYNATSLTQVFADYFSEQSIGDIGGNDAQYIPMAGYVGTLAPGELFKQNYSIEELPNRILHPWPAMQQIPFHVRWPPSHPLIAPPLLWFALNNMYQEDFAADQLERAGEEIVGGSLMQPYDAIRIAQGADFGASYVPEEQLKHGGSIFYNGHKIPNYTPDHGPTVPVEEAEPPIPESMRPLTELWLEPTYGMTMESVSIPFMTESLAQEEEEEEENRRAAAMEFEEKGWSWEGEVDGGAEAEDRQVRKPLWQEKEEALRAVAQAIEDEYVGEYKARAARKRIELTKMVGEGRDENEVLELGSDDDVAQHFKVLEEANYNRAVRAAKDVATMPELMRGKKARTQPALINYTIEVMGDTLKEMVALSIDITNSRKSKKRRRKITKSTNLYADALDGLEGAEPDLPSEIDDEV